ncbi:MAG: D-alanyl-D-alanine carboxypeptidase family protein [Actinomycetota bacterium]
MRKSVLSSIAVVLALVAPAVAVARPHRSPGPSPAPAPASAPSPVPTTIETPRPSLQAPEVEAASAILADLDTGQLLFATHPDDRRPIASTTKILTALLVLRTATPADVVTVGHEAAEEAHNLFSGSTELGLREGERLTVRQLLYALLLQSANDAAVALADFVSGSTDRFVARMNRFADGEGFTRTRFYSPNGLDDRGYSTARSLGAMAREALRVPAFSRIVRSRFHVVPAPPGGEPRPIQNRNVLLWGYPGAFGVKTGFTSKAGYCLVAAARKNGQRLVSVVLGEPSSADSFSDAAALLNYGFHAFVRSEVLADGQAAGTVTIGRVPIPVAAGASLSAWVPADNVDDPGVTRHLGSYETPVEAGDRIGSLRVTLDGRTLGTVPLLVVAAPPADQQTQPAPAAHPWWRRGADALRGAADDLFHAVFG